MEGLKKFLQKHNYSYRASLLLGIVVVVVAAHLPFLGSLFASIIVLTGLGLIVQRAQASWRFGQA